MKTFKCEFCDTEKPVSELSPIDFKDICNTCHDENMTCDETESVHFCSLCQMYSTTSESNPYGTCQCS